MTEQRLGIFGGTFDPPHRGHLAVASGALRLLSLDRLFWIPAWLSPFKEDAAQSTDPELRMEMVRLCSEAEDRFTVSLSEYKRQGTSYTVDTLELFARENPDAALYLIMGADTFAGFEGWKNPSRIRELARIVVYPRAGHTAPPSREEAEWLDIPEVDIASTEVRRLLRQGGDASPFLTTDVLDFIREHGLYGSQQQGIRHAAS